jgi:16S rRNA G527 N7-methylase RsmG
MLLRLPRCPPVARLPRAVASCATSNYTSGSGLQIPPSDLARVLGVLSNGGQAFNLGGRYSLDEHLDHVSTFAMKLRPLIKAGDRVVDMGAGSGILGFVCAFAYADVQFTLLDNRARCCEFLEAGILQLNLSERVNVLHSRAEAFGREPAHRHQYDGVMARRFSGGPATAAECAAPLLRRHGFILVSDPSADVQTHADRWPADGLGLLGLQVKDTLSLSLSPSIPLSPSLSLSLLLSPCHPLSLSLSLSFYPLVTLSLSFYPLVTLSLSFYPLVTLFLSFYPLVTLSLSFYPLVTLSLSFYPLVTLSLSFYPLVTLSLSFYPLVTLSLARVSLVGGGQRRSCFSAAR